VNVADLRPDGTAETARKTGLFRRLRLRRADGQIYLDRWGLAHDRIGGVLLHRMEAPDPGVDLHDHPWWFASFVLWGYTEQRAQTRLAPLLARIAELSRYATRGVVGRRGVGSFRSMRLDECHTITELHSRRCWTLVIRGPRRRRWGFYTPDGWIDEHTYDETIRVERRDLWNEVGT